MLTIREAQDVEFAKAVRLEFETRMVEHCRKFSPWLCARAGEEGVRRTIETALARRKEFDFDDEILMQFYIEMMFILGADFHDDPLYPWAAASLQPSSIYSTQSRAMQLHADLQSRVNDQDDAYPLPPVPVLRWLSALPAETLRGADWSSRLEREMNDANPRKYARQPGANFRRVFEAAARNAAFFRLPEPAGTATLATLMLSFGHGVLSDPLYPWIAATLTDSKIKTSGERLEQLQSEIRLYAKDALDSLE